MRSAGWLAAWVLGSSLGFGLGAGMTAAQTGRELVDPLTLLTQPDGSAARRGWLPLWNLEAEADWLQRLRGSPPKVEAAFLRWSPAAPRIGDFDLLVCLSRLMEEPELDRPGYSLAVTVEIADGTADAVEMQSGPLGSLGRERCVSIPEQHLQVGRGWREFSVAADLRYRPGRIKAVQAELRRQDGQLVHAARLTPSFHITPVRRGDGDLLRATRDFIAGRARGEAMRSARRCGNIATTEEITRPAGGDRSDYAQGFEVGWDLAGKFLDSDERCDALPVVFQIEEVGLGAAVRAVSKCEPALGLALSADHVCLRSAE
jgi:hypothetical protein